MRLMKSLDRAWRLFATALAFTVFGIGGLIMGLLIFPLMFVFISDVDLRTLKARRLVGRAFGAFWEMMCILRILDYEIKGRERIDPRRCQLIVANHPTLIDVVLLISLFPRANCVIKKAVTENIFMRSVVRAADYISNSAPEELLESCAAYLKAGGSLMLFPEGTRTKQEKGMDFKPGAAAAATRAGVEVLPIAIECKPLFLSKELPWYYVPYERPVFKVNILEAIPAVDQCADFTTARQARHELNSMIFRRISNELTGIEFSD